MANPGKPFPGVSQGLAQGPSLAGHADPFLNARDYQGPLPVHRRFPKPL